MFFINSYKPELKESLRSKGLDPDDFDILMVVAGFMASCCRNGSCTWSIQKRLIDRK